MLKRAKLCLMMAARNMRLDMIGYYGSRSHQREIEAIAAATRAPVETREINLRELARLKARHHDRGWPKGTARDLQTNARGPSATELREETLRLSNEAIKRDPRADGFNYGAALGAPKADPNDTTVPWERRDMAAEYAHIVRMAQSFGSIAIKLSAAAWKLEMVTREVRNATTHSEQLTAMEHARKAWGEVNSLDRIEGDGVSFYRYGRSLAVSCS